MGDFVRGAPEGNFSPGICAGIHLHRAVDGFTNDHPETSRALDLFPDHRRMVAAIALDIAYDHFLARDWNHWHPMPLQDFTSQVYEDLMTQPRPLPGDLDWMADVMAAEDLLAGYAHPARVRSALERTAMRLRNPSLMSGLADEVFRHEEALGNHFNQFLPQLLTHAQTVQKRLNHE